MTTAMPATDKQLVLEAIGRLPDGATFDEMREQFDRLAVDRHIPGSGLTDAQRTELLRRAAEDDTDPDGGIPWAEIKAQALARFAP